MTTIQIQIVQMKAPNRKEVGWYVKLWTLKLTSSTKANEDNKLIKLMNILEKVVQTNINPSTCMQQFVCSISKSTTQNVARGCGTSTEKILDGIFRFVEQLQLYKFVKISRKFCSATWIRDVIMGSTFHDAIRYGKSPDDCYLKYKKCGFGSTIMKKLFDMLMRSIGKINR